MRAFKFLPPAMEEMAEAAEYYEGCAPGLGCEFLTEVRSAVDQVLTRPGAWAQVRPGVRRYYTLRFPFAVIYAHDKTTVTVLAVMHLRKKPDYWQDRL